MIYVLTHRDFDEYFLRFFESRVLFMGLEAPAKPYWLRDCIGDNIAEKNPTYCELTGIYWLWKNTDLSPEDVLGVCHYSRYFLTSGGRPLKQKGAEYYLSDHDILLPAALEFDETVFEQYARWHNREDLELFTEIIRTHYPDWEIDPILQGNRLYPYNMFISRKRLYDEYCSWLFPLLTELEQKIGISEDPYQKRVFGFLAERGLNIWIANRGCRVKELPVLVMTEPI